VLNLLHNAELDPVCSPIGFFYLKKNIKSCTHMKGSGIRLQA